MVQFCVISVILGGTSVVQFSCDLCDLRWDLGGPVLCELGRTSVV